MTQLSTQFPTLIATMLCLLWQPHLLQGQTPSPPAPASAPAPARTDRPPVLLAHYMPWYTARPFSDHWGWHWTMNHFDPTQIIDGQPRIASRYQPLIGPYDSGDPDVLEYHLLLMKLAGIDGVIVDWYGLTDFRDYALLHTNTTRLLQQCERLRMKFVICYEDQTIPALVEAGRITANHRIAHAVAEINWLGQYWFRSGSYLKLDDKPVLLSFGHTGLTATEWSQCLQQLTQPVSYFSQDFRRDGAVGGFGWPAPQVGLLQVDRFLQEAINWPACIPAAFPRFNDIYREAGAGNSYPQLPDDSGRTFQSTLRKALDSHSPIIQVATWNDWGEGTQIEPSREFQYRDLQYLQSIRYAPQQGPTVNDLRLPLRLLQLRKSADTPETRQALDQIAQQLSRNELQPARHHVDLLTGVVRPQP